MTLQEVLGEGNKIRRSSWENQTFYMVIEDGEIKTYDEDPIQETPNYSLAFLNVGDLLAYDWEAINKVEIPTRIELRDVTEDKFTLCRRGGNIHILVEAGVDEYQFSESNVEDMLTFLYNHTETGKKRVIPF